MPGSRRAVTLPGMSTDTSPSKRSKPKTGTDTGLPTIDVAHFSDTHVAFSQYPVTSPTSGRNQREQDVLRAFAGVCTDIGEWDPPLVIHSGDVAEKPLITYRHQLQIQTAFRDLTRRPDGSPRMVVVIAGNHDAPKDSREPCYLEPALRPLPSVAVVTNAYRQVHLAEYVDAGAAHESLRDVVVHCLPHDILKGVDWDEVTPVPGKINILTSHGVVGNSELYRRCLGREYAVDTDVLLRGWDYVAMGHYHKPGPVAVGGLKDDTTPIWYAGSTENCGFSDLRDGVDGRGYLRVQVTAGQVPAVTKVNLPIRAMFRLPAIDADGMNFEQLGAALKARIAEADIVGAVVDQKVTNVSRDTWSLVDLAEVRRAAGTALWYQPTPVFAKTETGQDDGDGTERLGNIGQVLTETAAALISDDSERDAVLDLSRKLLGSALDDVPEQKAGKDADDGDSTDTEAVDVGGQSRGAAAAGTGETAGQPDGDLVTAGV